MNVRVTKFDRFVDSSQVCVGFYVSHPSVDSGLYVDSLVSMQGSDANMIDLAWIGVLPRVSEWVKTNQSRTVGTTFTVPVVVVTAPEPAPAPAPAPEPAPAPAPEPAPESSS